MRRIPRPLQLLLLMLGVVLVTACQPVPVGKQATPPRQAKVNPPAAPQSAACQGGATRQGLRSVPVYSQGKTYSVPTYFPGSYTNQRRVPLLLDLHGSSSNGMRQMRFSDLNQVAAREGFLVAAPNGGVHEGYRKGRMRHSWNVPGVPLFGGAPVPAGTRNDVRFLQDVISQLAASNCVNTAKIYVAGFSGGARMASALACSDASQVSGIIAVSGLRAGPADARGTAPQRGGCKPAKPVSVIAFHGIADKTAPYYGGTGREWAYSVPSALHEWARLNRCAPNAKYSKAGRYVQLTDYPDCADRDGNHTTVQLWGIRGGGHRWPGNDNSTAYTSGNTSHEISVADVVGNLLRDRSA